MALAMSCNPKMFNYKPVPNHKVGLLNLNLEVTARLDPVSFIPVKFTHNSKISCPPDINKLLGNVAIAAGYSTDPK